MLGLTLPHVLGHVWPWFLDLHADRGSTGFGPAPITYPSIDAWARLTGWQPRPREVEAIRALDRAWRDDLRASEGDDPGDRA